MVFTSLGLKLEEYLEKLTLRAEINLTHVLRSAFI